MNLTERLAEARRLREARQEGLEAATGLLRGRAAERSHAERVAERAPEEPEESDRRLCRACGTPGRIDLVDLVTDIAELTCPSCATTWQISSRQASIS